jgi:DNA-directed RNA polymerase sigma subunit (sigma70/sigma32)
VGRTFRLPEDIQLIGKISKAQGVFISRSQQSFHEELAAILDVTVKSVKKAMSYIFESISLYTHVRNDDDESGYTISLYYTDAM